MIGMAISAYNPNLSLIAPPALVRFSRMFVLLIFDLVYSDMVMILALLLLMLAQLVTVLEATMGFANVGLLTVLVLFIVAGGISKTGGLDWYMGKYLGAPRTLVAAQMKLMVPIAIISAFMNNTPVVLIMIPIVQRWCRKIKKPVSQMLVPLSFASILGGTCTLIGTSTNLVVQGLLNEVSTTMTAKEERSECSVRFGSAWLGSVRVVGQAKPFKSQLTQSQ